MKYKLLLFLGLILLFSQVSVVGALDISSCADLQKIVAGDLGGNFILTNNIDCSDTVNWNSGAGFEPIGNISSPFSGSFYGAGFNITNLTINRSNTSWVGLFANAKNSDIKNVNFIYSNIKGHDYVGTITGRMRGGNIYDCSSSSLLLDGNNYVGGLVGYSSGVVFYSSFASGSVNGTSYLGGLVGGLMGNVVGGANSISVSYSDVSVTGTSYLGSLVGYSAGNSIRSSYSTGSVNGTSYLGGLVGYSEGGDIIRNSYSTGFVSGVSYLGGLIGNFSKVIASFYDNETSGQNDTGKGLGLSTADMQFHEIYANADWSMNCSASKSVWGIDDYANDYPCLMWEDDCVCNFFKPLVIVEEESSSDKEFVVSVVPGCPYKTTTVIVYGSNGNPIKNANIKLISEIESYMGLTDEEGLYSINLAKELYSLNVQKPGYIDVDAIFRIIPCEDTTDGGDNEKIIAEIIERFSKAGTSDDPYIPEGAAAIPVLKSVPSDGENILLEQDIESAEEETKVLSFKSAASFSFFMFLLISLLVIVIIYIQHKVRSHKKQ